MEEGDVDGDDYDGGGGGAGVYGAERGPLRSPARSALTRRQAAVAAGAGKVAGPNILRSPVSQRPSCYDDDTDSRVSGRGSGPYAPPKARQHVFGVSGARCLSYVCVKEPGQAARRQRRLLPLSSQTAVPDRLLR